MNCLRMMLVVGAVGGLVPLCVQAQVQIVSFESGGSLVCSNLAAGSTATVEWASAPGGGWTNGAHGSARFAVGSNGLLEAEVPMGLAPAMFFRVQGHERGTEVIPPAGMVLIPAGTNSGTNPLGPGDPAYDPFWYPSNYTLTVSAFYMDKYEVTKALWDEVATWAISHGYVFDRTSQFPGADRGTNYPVQTVTWYDCVKWCNARSEKENRPVCYWDGAAVYRTGQQFRVSCTTNAPGYRLPTDMEWEYAARGGVSGKQFPWGGDTISYAYANYYAVKWSNYDLSTGGYHPNYTNAPTPPHTSPVGAFELGKNGYGLYDMARNVAEWCWEWDIQGYTFRILRGGSADQSSTWSRIGRRSNNGPDYGFYNVGFRTVMARPQ